MAGLTNKQQAFINEYLKTWNATEAARRAGYAESYLHTNANKLLQNTTIAAAIKERIEAAVMSADEVLLRLADHARGDLSPFLRTIGGQVSFDLSSETAAEKMHLIKKVKQVQKRGTSKTGGEWEEEYTEIEIHDPQAALVHIGRYHKLFTDKQEQTGPDGKAMRILIEYADNNNGNAP